MIRNLLNIVCIVLALSGCTGDDETNFLHLEVQGEIDLGPEFAGKEVTLNVAWQNYSEWEGEITLLNAVLVNLDEVTLGAEGTGSFTTDDFEPPPIEALADLSRLSEYDTGEEFLQEYSEAEGMFGHAWIIGCTEPTEAGLCASLVEPDAEDVATQEPFLLSSSHRLHYFTGLNAKGVELLKNNLDRARVFNSPENTFPAEQDESRMVFSRWRCGDFEQPKMELLTPDKAEASRVTFVDLGSEEGDRAFKRHERCEEDTAWQTGDLGIRAVDHPDTLEIDQLDQLVVVTLEEVYNPGGPPQFENLMFELDRAENRFFRSRVLEEDDEPLIATLADTNANGLWDIDESVTLAEGAIDDQFWSAEHSDAPPLTANVSITHVREIRENGYSGTVVSQGELQVE